MAERSESWPSPPPRCCRWPHRLDLEVLVGRPVLVLFLCAHCPFVEHIEPELTRLAGEHAGGAGPDGLQLIGISSNSTLTHPQDGPEGLRAQAACNARSVPV